MRLSITTYDIFKGWDVNTLCAELPRAGVEAVEFRISSGHAHGVDVTMPKEAREEVRAKLEAAELFTCSIATGCRFHMEDTDELEANVHQAVGAIELAADLGAPFVRVFGNNVVEGVHPDTTAAQVGQALAVLGVPAGCLGVEVLLEMHGDFNDFRLCRNAVRFANHRSIGVLYNCDRRDVVAGSISTIWHEMKSLIRHIHFHDLLDDDYPYEELFGLLAQDGYTDCMSMEVSMACEGDDDVRANLAAQAQRFVELRDAALAGTG